MKRLIFLLIVIVGGYLVYRIAGDYWVLGWLGLCLAFALTCRKLHLGDALRLWGIVLAIVAVMLGGGLIIARQWGGAAYGVWIVFCLILLMIFKNRIVRLIPIFYLAEIFEEVVKEATEKESE